MQIGPRSYPLYDLIIRLLQSPAQHQVLNDKALRRGPRTHQRTADEDPDRIPPGEGRRKSEEKALHDNRDHRTDALTRWREGL